MNSINIHQDIKYVKRERGRTKRERKQRTAISQNRPSKKCASQFLEPINKLPYMAKGTSHIWLSWGLGDGEVVLDYLDGPDTILKVLKSATRKQKQKAEWCSEKRLSLTIAGFEGAKRGPRTKECRFQDLEKSRKHILSLPLKSPEWNTAPKPSPLPSALMSDS